MKVAFVVGCESTRDYPGDTPEAYWRVLVPSRRYGVALVVGAPGALEAALAADVVWLYEPTCEAAVELAETTRAAGRRLVVDFSEDIWRRGEQDRGYSQVRLEAAARSLELANRVVVATPGLVDTYRDFGNVAVVETVLPDRYMRPAQPAHEPLVGWWSDGRQRQGFEVVAPALRAHLRRGVRMRHIQFSHHAPLVAGLTPEESRREAAKLGAYFGDSLNRSAESNCWWFRDLLAECWVSLECYVPGRYADTVSDIPILRAAALGIPVLSTRRDSPPGSVSCSPSEWEAALAELLADRDLRERLAQEGLRWAKTRLSFDAYDRVLKEVSHGTDSPRCP